MSLFDRFFGGQKNSAQQAGDRLKIMLAKERTSKLPYLEEMRQELIEVVKKYTEVDNVTIKTDHNQDIDMLEVEIVLGRSKR